MRRFPFLCLVGLCVGPSAFLKAEAFPDVDQLPSLAAAPSPLEGVHTAGDWPARREVLKRTVEYYSLGHPPADPGPGIPTVTPPQLIFANRATYQRVEIAVGPGHSIHLVAALFLPVTMTPTPVILFPTFTGTPGEPRPPEAGPKYRTVTPEEFATARTEELLKGYGFLTFVYTDSAKDSADRANGVFAAYPGTDAGDLAIWAWAISRWVDFLESRPEVDASKIALVGHSRIGKAVLVAGALDERISLVVAAGSGCGGTGSFRVNGKARTGKEGLEEVTARFPYWFTPRLKAFSGHVDKLPFDQDWLMALVAPRPLLSEEGLADQACNSKASVASFRETLPVYQFLGAPDNLGLHFRPGPHELNSADWEAIREFMEDHFRGRRAAIDFHAIPAEATEGGPAPKGP